MIGTHARSALAAGTVLAALLCGGAFAAQHMHRHLLQTGDRLVPFGVRSLAGPQVTLAPAGRAQIINIFATWCPPCRSETPAFAAYARQFKENGIDVIGIDQQESRAQVERFARSFGLAYPVYIDTGTVTRDLLGARMIPTTIFVDASGVIRWEHAGPLTRTDLTGLAQLAQSAEGNG